MTRVGATESPRGEGPAGGGSPGIPFECEHPNFAYRSTPFCELHSAIRSGILPVLQGTIKAGDRGVENRCVRCCCVTSAGASVAMELEKRARGVICSSAPGCRGIDAVLLTGKEELLAGTTCPSFQTAVRAEPFAPQIAPRPLQINSRIIFFLAGGDL